VDRALSRLQKAPQPQRILEMRLQVALGHCLWYTAHEPNGVQRAFQRARELAIGCGDTSVELHCLWGLWGGRRGRGE
jgi:hypothetical protein